MKITITRENGGSHAKLEDGAVKDYLPALLGTAEEIVRKEFSMSLLEFMQAYDSFKQIHMIQELMSTLNAAAKGDNE